MKITKEPVYVNGKPYKVTIKKKCKEGWLYWYVKFYKPGHIFCCETCLIEDIERSVVDYVSIVKEAVKRFEGDLEKEQRQADFDRELQEWDGR